MLDVDHSRAFRDILLRSKDTADVQDHLARHAANREYHERYLRLAVGRRCLDNERRSWGGGEAGTVNGIQQQPNSSCHDFVSIFSILLYHPWADFTR